MRSEPRLPRREKAYREHLQVGMLHFKTSRNVKTGKIEAAEVNFRVPDSHGEAKVCPVFWYYPKDGVIYVTAHPNLGHVSDEQLLKGGGTERSWGFEFQVEYAPVTEETLIEFFLKTKEPLDLAEQLRGLSIKSRLLKKWGLKDDQARMLKGAINKAIEILLSQSSDSKPN